MFDSTTIECFKRNITWKEAVAYCESLGGHLVTINTDGEKTFIKNNYSTGQFFVGATSQNNWITGETGLWENNWIAENDNKTISAFICEWE